MNTFPELPLDPPDDEMPECPQCDVPLTTARPGLAECGSVRRYRWLEYQAAMALRQMPRKLRDYASKLDNDTAHPRYL